MNPSPDSQDAAESAGCLSTCLEAQHVKLGAILIDFHGWRMPLRYQSIPEEHNKVRLSAGLFDLCHMGRLEIAGPSAARWIDKVITNNYDSMKPGKARYTLICNENGMILDDAIIYKLPPSPAGGVSERPFLVVNASNRRKVIEWMESARGDLDAEIIDRTREMAMVAIQGPHAVHILPAAVERLDGDWSSMKYYSIATARVRGEDALIARTGYTGEDGFEVYFPAQKAPAFWESVLDIGGRRIAPVGLGARDTLRLEAGMPLYGNELDEQTDPFEAGLGFAVKLDKPVPFIGCESLRERKERGVSRRLKGFRVLGRRVARQGMPLDLEGRGPVGIVTSGAPSPTLGYPVAMGYLDATVQETDLASLRVDIRGRLEPVQIEPMPFYSRTRKKETGGGQGT